MSKVTKVILITAGALIAIGVIVTIIGAIVLRNTAKKAVSGQETYTHMEKTLEDDFDKIDISEISHDVIIRPSEDGEVKVDYYDSEKYVHTVEVKNDTLRIAVNDINNGRPWYENITIINPFQSTNNTDYQIIIYLPEDSYGSLTIDAVSSDVTVPENYSFENVKFATTSGEVHSYCVATGEVEADTVSGNVDLKNVNATALDIDTTSGEITLTDVKVTGLLSISTTSGEVKLTDVETDDLNVNTVSGEVFLSGLITETANIDTTSGDVTGTISGEHEYEVDTVSGDVDLPSNIRGASVIEIDTVSGDVSIEEAA